VGKRCERRRFEHRIALIAEKREECEENSFGRLPAVVFARRARRYILHLALSRQIAQAIDPGGRVFTIDIGGISEAICIGRATR
jgi:hypothetical protein